MEWHEDSFFLVLDYCCNSVISGVSLLSSEPLDIIIVCIVANQGLANKIKWDKGGLVMRFVQINCEKERGEIVWLHFGDASLQRGKTYFPAADITQTFFDTTQKYVVYTNQEQFISDTTVCSHCIVLFTRSSAKLKTLTEISAQLDLAQ